MYNLNQKFQDVKDAAAKTGFFSTKSLCTNATYVYAVIKLHFDLQYLMCKLSALKIIFS